MWLGERLDEWIDLEQVLVWKFEYKEPQFVFGARVFQLRRSVGSVDDDAIGVCDSGRRGWAFCWSALGMVRDDASAYEKRVLLIAGAHRFNIPRRCDRELLWRRRLC